MTRAIPMRLLLPLLLGLACVPPAWMIVQELDRGLGSDGSAAPASDGASDPVSLPSLATPDAPAMQAFAEILERPIFLSSRRPFVAEPAPVAGPEPLPDVALQLAGIVLAAAERFALVQAGGQPALVRVREGDTLGGWRVIAIDADGLWLRRGDRNRELRLDYRGQGSSQAPPAIPAPAPAP